MSQKVVNGEQIQIMCLVSSAAFSAASCVWSWTAPIGAVLGLFGSIKAEKRPVLAKQFENAVAVALEKTKNDLTTKDSIAILNELSSTIVRPDNIDELISKTETYRKSYCTQLDRKRIIEIFEVHFKEEVCKCSELSHQYLLAAGALTLEGIKNINNVLTAQDKNLINIKHSVDDINSKADKILSIIKALLGECGFILTAVAGCLVAGAIFAVSTNLFYLHVFMCYLFATLFSCGILKPVNAFVSSLITKKHLPLKTVSFLWVSAFIYTTISIGAYLVIVASQLSVPLTITKNEIMSVAIGGVIHQICKASYEAYDLQLVDHGKDSAANDEDSAKMHNNFEE